LIPYIEGYAHSYTFVDPFGNYLCQKLLEYSTDDQRNALCESVAQDLVNISLNMHGTRAVQKMIDFLSSRRQVRKTCLIQLPLLNNCEAERCQMQCADTLDHNGT
jgi:hypothetical protein